MSFVTPTTGKGLSAAHRTAVMAPLGLLFVILLPAGLLRLGRYLDRIFNLAPEGREPGRRVLALLLGVPGWALALWANYAQFTRGKGTPMPVFAPRKLLVEPPYTHTRNPMALGTFMAYLGLAMWAGSRGMAALVVGLTGALLVYIKRVEEPELVQRFGESYLAYRAQTPFFLPRLPH